MVFKAYPTLNLERKADRWVYDIDLKVLENMKNEKKKDPGSKHFLSVSGIDLLFRLLEKDPDKRLNAKNALNHHWFINFTNKPQENRKLQKFREQNGMDSLRTILECSEFSEKELENGSRLHLIS